jgi:DNA-binding NarL/FixJ family response regulator
LAPRGPGGTLATVPPVTVLTVDDHASFRVAARAVIAATPGFAPVGEFASAEEALEGAVELDPALALVDVNMPGIDGIATSRRLRRARPGTTVVLISASELADPPGALAAAGAVAFVPKTRLTPGALRALWDEHAGE